MIVIRKRPFHRSFDVDRYLDRQLNRKRIERAIQQHGVPEYFYCDNGKDYRTAQSGFRPWAVRLNDRIERWLERVDWKGFELRFEKLLMGTVLSGAALYLLVAIVDAWLQGHFNLGGAR